MAEVLEPGEWELWDSWIRAHRLLVRELDRNLQRESGISKAEFSVLVRLSRAPDGEMRVADLVDSLAWEKSRLSHQLTRMENRGLVEQTERAASGRRTRIGLTPEGRRLAHSAVDVHARNIRRLFFDSLTPAQKATIRDWSEQLIDRIEPEHP